MKIKQLLSLSFISSISLFSYSQPLENWEADKIKVTQSNGVQTIMHAEALFEDRWDQLPQAQFWKKIMLLSPDSCLINVAATRQLLDKMSNREWNAQTEAQKDSTRQALRIAHGLPSDTRIYVTTGKNDFYRFSEVYPSLDNGIQAFERYGVDPWYAQSILLIESPAQIRKSSTGAYGAFQLMPGVARSMGLVVNNTTDERKDFDRSAYGAAQLISRVCIPEAKRILNQHNLSYNETDLWFRLFVLHVYHAGAMNVAAVVNKIQPKEGSQALIKAMWQNSAAGFGNNSQNYTQLALAAQLILHDMVYQNCTEISSCLSR
ncbi:MAG: transglycosylase SLT domain-containing protein [Flavobacteriales bacterium]|jgi:hypothetical protein